MQLQPQAFRPAHFLDNGLRRTVTFTVLAVLVSGCAVANYEKPIAQFAEATKKAEMALASLNKHTTEAYSNILKRKAKVGDRLVQAKSDDCLAGSKRCRLVLLDRRRNEEALTPGPSIPRMLIVMADIRQYADGLHALLKAENGQKASAHVNEALGSIQDLAKKLGDGGAPTAIPDFATPVGAGANWLIGQYVNKVKLDGLRHATKSAKPVIASAADLFATAASFGLDAHKARIAEGISERIDAFKRGPTDSNLEALIKDAVAYDRLLSIKPGETFHKLASAHSALADRLQDRSVSLVDAFEKIEAFAEEAEQLAKIVQDIVALGSASEK